MAFETIALDVADGIATLTLRRPDRLNAFTWTMMTELIAAFDRTDADDAVRVVLVTGAGRAFCAGADLGEGGATFDNSARETRDEHRDGGGQVVLRIFESRKPVIAAVNGPAVGVGATMTLPMDVRIASTAAKFGFVFTRRGIVPEACSSWFLPRLVGISRAAEWVYTGRLFGPDEALAGGLVSGVGPRDRRQHLGRLRRPLTRSAVAHARCRPSDGGTPHRFEVHLRDGSVGRRARRRDRVPGEAPGPLHDAPEPRHAGRLPLVAGPTVQALTTASDS
jgi:enoyl-CoA hydratase/carnithine racemase